MLLALLARQLLAPLMGVPRAPKDVFAVYVEDEEALVAFDDRWDLGGPYPRSG